LTQVNISIVTYVHGRHKCHTTGTVVLVRDQQQGLLESPLLGSRFCTVGRARSCDDSEREFLTVGIFSVAGQIRQMKDLTLLVDGFQLSISKKLLNFP